MAELGSAIGRGPLGVYDYATGNGNYLEAYKFQNVDPDAVAGLNLGLAIVTLGTSGAATTALTTATRARGAGSAVSISRAAKLGGGVSVESGAGGLTLPMSTVRNINRGEKIVEIVNEAKALTFTTGNEHALVTLQSGQRALVSGGPSGIDFRVGQIKRIFGHTHPDRSPPSNADFLATRMLGQTRQEVYHGGQVTRVRVSK